MGTRRMFTREFKLQEVRLVNEQGVKVWQAAQAAGRYRRTTRELDCIECTRSAIWGHGAEPATGRRLHIAFGRMKDGCTLLLSLIFSLIELWVGR
jgi:hypothetical protein